MTTAAASAPADPRRHPHHRRRAQQPRHDWARAFRAIQALIKNKEDTAEVFALFRALNGNSSARGYMRLCETDEGGRIAYERPELWKRQLDKDWVASFPPDSVGAAYRRYLDVNHFSEEAFLQENHKGLAEAEWNPEHPYAWYERRIRDAHDIWHVLLGYDRDHLGEICLLNFVYQETHGFGRAFLVLAAWLRAHGPSAGQARKAINEAKRRGRHAAWLPAEDYEALMFEPLEDARRRLGLTPPVEYQKVPAADRDLAVT